MLCAYGVISLRAETARACNVERDPNCVGVGAVSPGRGGHQGGGSPTASGPVAPDPCSGSAGYAYIACVNGGITTISVCVPLYDQLAPTESLAALNAQLTRNGCPPAPAARAATPISLALRAASTFDLPEPSGHRSPGETNSFRGYPFTWVKPLDLLLDR